MIDLMRGLVMTNTVTVDDMKTLEGLVLAEMTCNLQKLSDVLQAASKMTGCEDVPVDLSKGDCVSPLSAPKGVYVSPLCLFKGGRRMSNSDNNKEFPIF